MIALLVQGRSFRSEPNKSPQYACYYIKQQQQKTALKSICLRCFPKKKDEQQSHDFINS